MLDVLGFAVPPPFMDGVVEKMISSEDERFAGCRYLFNAFKHVKVITREFTESAEFGAIMRVRYYGDPEQMSDEGLFVCWQVPQKEVRVYSGHLEDIVREFSASGAT